MKVILKSYIKSLGTVGDVVEVSDGYARNYLLPSGRAIEANKANLNNLKLQKDNKEKIEKEQYNKALELKGLLDNKELVMELHIGENYKIFGSISAKDIEQAIKEQLKLEIDKKKIQLNKPIKTLDDTKVKIKLHSKVTAEINLKITGTK